MNPWFNMGMSRSEKLEARLPWRSSIIIKLVGRKMEHHYLSKRIQSMWKPQSAINMMVLTNDFFIVGFTNREDYNNALLNGLG